MVSDLMEVLGQIPVQVKGEAVRENSPWKLYVGICVANDGKMSIDLESRKMENGETVEHAAYICLPPFAYQVDLLAKTYKAMRSEVGFNFDSMGLKVVEVVHEEPDPHLFLITADLRPE
jgi:hypothetical protein